MSALAASPFPFTDWQFWVTTAVFLVAAAWLLREVLPIPLIGKRRRRRGQRVNLTVRGKPPET